MDNLKRAEAAACRAISIAGGYDGLAQALRSRGVKISRQAIRYWVRIPKKRLEAVAEITGLAAHELRPDLFETTETTV